MSERDEAIRARCEDCGLEYPFPDYVLPDEIWKRIAPQPDGNGLLCPTCIAKRLDAIGLWYQEGYFKPDGYSAFNPLQAEVKRLTSDRDAAQRRAEAAEADLNHIAQEMFSDNSDDLRGNWYPCEVCKKYDDGKDCYDCFAAVYDESDPGTAFEWRGPDAGGKQKEDRNV